MEIESAEFVRGVIGDNYMVGDGYPQIAFLGRSNVGKSSVINSLVGRKKLARSSTAPGKTQEANFYLINNSIYFIDFPGYGYAKMSQKKRDKLAKRILWYLQYSPVRPKVVILIVDIQVGITDLDKEMLRILNVYGHKIILVANKIDKLKQQEVVKQHEKIREELSDIDILNYSAKTKKGKRQLLEKISGYIADR